MQRGIFMKKLIALLLAGSIFLSACSKQEGKTAPDISPQPSSSAEAPSESVPGDEPESEPEQVVDNDWQFDTPENHGDRMEGVHTGLIVILLIIFVYDDAILCCYHRINRSIRQYRVHLCQYC